MDNVKSTLCSNINIHWLILHQRFQKQTLTKSSGVTNLRRVLITRKAIENSKQIGTAQDLYILSYVTCSSIYGVEKILPIDNFFFMVLLKKYQYSIFRIFLIKKNFIRYAMSFFVKKHVDDNQVCIELPKTLFMKCLKKKIKKYRTLISSLLNARINNSGIVNSQFEIFAVYLFLGPKSS